MTRSYYDYMAQQLVKLQLEDKFFFSLILKKM